MDFIFNLPPKEYSLSAFIIADILTEGLTVNEQNTLANYFQLLGQVIITNAGQMEVQNGTHNNDISIKG